MENKGSSSSTFFEKISSGLKKAQIEIEELAVQYSLGKAEAVDKFEAIKKEVNTKSIEWKEKYSKLEELGKEKSIELKTKLETLQVQLALGKAEAKEIYAEQKKKILNSIRDIEEQLRNRG